MTLNASKEGNLWVISGGRVLRGKDPKAFFRILSDPLMAPMVFRSVTSCRILSHRPEVGTVVVEQNWSIKVLKRFELKSSVETLYRVCPETNVVEIEMLSKSRFFKTFNDKWTISSETDGATTVSRTFKCHPAFPGPQKKILLNAANQVFDDLQRAVEADHQTELESIKCSESGPSTARFRPLSSSSSSSPRATYQMRQKEEESRHYEPCVNPPMLLSHPLDDTT